MVEIASCAGKILSGSSFSRYLGSAHISSLGTPVSCQRTEGARPVVHQLGATLGKFPSVGIKSVCAQGAPPPALLRSIAVKRVNSQHEPALRLNGARDHKHNASTVLDNDLARTYAFGWDQEAPTAL